MSLRDGIKSAFNNKAAKIADIFSPLIGAFAGLGVAGAFGLPITGGLLAGGLATLPATLPTLGIMEVGGVAAKFTSIAIKKAKAKKAVKFEKQQKPKP